MQSATVGLLRGVGAQTTSQPPTGSAIALSSAINNEAQQAVTPMAATGRVLHHQQRNSLTSSSQSQSSSSSSSRASSSSSTYSSLSSPTSSNLKQQQGANNGYANVMTHPNKGNYTSTSNKLVVSCSSSSSLSGGVEEGATGATNVSDRCKQLAMIDARLTQSAAAQIAEETNKLVDAYDFKARLRMLQNKLCPSTSSSSLVSSTCFVNDGDNDDATNVRQDLAASGQQVNRLGAQSSPERRRRVSPKRTSVASRCRDFDSKSWTTEREKTTPPPAQQVDAAHRLRRPVNDSSLVDSTTTTTRASVTSSSKVMDATTCVFNAADNDNGFLRAPTTSHEFACKRINESNSNASGAQQQVTCPPSSQPRREDSSECPPPTSSACSIDTTTTSPSSSPPPTPPPRLSSLPASRRRAAPPVPKATPMATSVSDALAAIELQHRCLPTQVIMNDRRRYNQQSDDKIIPASNARSIPIIKPTTNATWTMSPGIQSINNSPEDNGFGAASKRAPITKALQEMFKQQQYLSNQNLNVIQEQQQQTHPIHQNHLPNASQIRSSQMSLSSSSPSHQTPVSAPVFIRAPQVHPNQRVQQQQQYQPPLLRRQSRLSADSMSASSSSLSSATSSISRDSNPATQLAAPALPQRPWQMRAGRQMPLADQQTSTKHARDNEKANKRSSQFFDTQPEVPAALPVHCFQAAEDRSAAADEDCEEEELLGDKCCACERHLFGTLPAGEGATDRLKSVRNTSLVADLQSGAHSIELVRSADLLLEPCCTTSRTTSKCVFDGWPSAYDDNDDDGDTLNQTACTMSASDGWFTSVALHENPLESYEEERDAPEVYDDVVGQGASAALVRRSCTTQSGSLNDCKLLERSRLLSLRTDQYERRAAIRLISDDSVQLLVSSAANGNTKGAPTTKLQEDAKEDEREAAFEEAPLQSPQTQSATTPLQRQRTPAGNSDTCCAGDDTMQQQRTATMQSQSQTSNRLLLLRNAAACSGHDAAAASSSSSLPAPDNGRWPSERVALLAKAASTETKPRPSCQQQRINGAAQQVNSPGEPALLQRLNRSAAAAAQAQTPRQTQKLPTLEQVQRRMQQLRGHGNSAVRSDAAASAASSKWISSRQQQRVVVATDTERDSAVAEQTCDRTNEAERSTCAQSGTYSQIEASNAAESDVREEATGEEQFGRNKNVQNDTSKQQQTQQVTQHRRPVEEALSVAVDLAPPAGAAGPPLIRPHEQRMSGASEIIGPKTGGETSEPPLSVGSSACCAESQVSVSSADSMAALIREAELDGSSEQLIPKLIERLDRKLIVMKEEQLSLMREIELNERVGRRLFDSMRARLTSKEFEKITLHAEEIEKVTKLRLSLKMRLKRIESELNDRCNSTQLPSIGSPQAKKPSRQSQTKPVKSSQNQRNVSLRVTSDPMSQATSNSLVAFAAATSLTTTTTTTTATAATTTSSRTQPSSQLRNVSDPSASASSSMMAAAATIHKYRNHQHHSSLQSSISSSRSTATVSEGLPTSSSSSSSSSSASSNNNSSNDSIFNCADSAIGSTIHGGSSTNIQPQPTSQSSLILVEGERDANGDESEPTTLQQNASEQTNAQVIVTTDLSTSNSNISSASSTHGSSMNVSSISSSSSMANTPPLVISPANATAAKTTSSGAAVARDPTNKSLSGCAPNPIIDSLVLTDTDILIAKRNKLSSQLEEAYQLEECITERNGIIVERILKKYYDEQEDREIGEFRQFTRLKSLLLKDTHDVADRIDQAELQILELKQTTTTTTATANSNNTSLQVNDPNSITAIDIAASSA